MISKQTRSAIVYIVSIVGIVFGTIILVALARGYSYDFFSGQIKETGLVIINSQPAGADISFNGAASQHKTPFRLVNAEPGELTVGLKKADYRDWQKKLDVKAQEVSFADRALLMPKSIFYDNLYDNFRAAQAVQSNDNRRVAFVVAADLSIWLSDNEKTPVKIYQPPQTTQPDETITAINGLQLSPNNGNQLLMRAVSQARTNFFVLPTSGDQAPLNVNTTFGIEGGSFEFNPTSDRELYWLKDGQLRKLNLDAKTAGPVLAENIAYLKIKNDRIFYISSLTPTNLSHELWSMDLNGVRKIKILSSVVDSPEYKLDFARVRQQDYLMLLAAKDRTAVLYSNIYDKPVSSVLSKDAADFTFSPDGTYLVVNHAQTTKSYNLELSGRFNFPTSLAGITSWRWLDSYHLLVVSNGNLRLMDFDGQNDQLISQPTDQVTTVLPNNDVKSINYIATDGQVKKLYLTPKKK